MDELSVKLLQNFDKNDEYGSLSNAVTYVLKQDNKVIIQA